jgi:hypothetical protein
MLQRSVLNISSVFLTYCCKCVYECYIHFTHTFQVFYLDIAYVYNGFQVFFLCFCKCFRNMFQVFHSSSDVYCKCCIWMFESRSGVVHVEIRVTSGGDMSGPHA